MKNKNALTILLYVFAVLSLAYTCYAAIQAYNTFTSYYSTNLSVVNLILYMITTCYESICFSVLFYALGVFSEMFKKKEEEKQFYTVSSFFCLPTYISRMLPALFMDKIQVSGKVNIFLQLIPYTAMASLIFPAILYVDKNIWIGIIASVVAVIAALKKLPVIGVVLASVISCVIFYMFMLSQKCKNFTTIL